MLSVKIQSKDNGRFAKISHNARSITGSVNVGYWENQGKHGKSSITISRLATVHERGLGVKNRAFVKPALTANRQKYIGLMARNLDSILDGRSPIRKIWGLIGAMAVGDVQKYMTTAKFAPLARSTIKRKGSSRPLIDTGQLKQAITYRVGG